MREDGKNYQLPGHMVAPEFGEVNISVTSVGIKVSFTILMEPQGADAEGWQTGVALDGSASMKAWYGKSLLGEVPSSIAAEYERKGWISIEKEDGHNVKLFQRPAYEDALDKGYMKFTENIVQKTAREFTAYLASNLDADGGTTVIYWACGEGKQIEEIGDLTSEDCGNKKFSGPERMGFGKGTFLAPAVKYFVDRFKDAKNGMYIFVTDGELDDLEDVKIYTKKLCREIADGRRHRLKCVLIGVGDQINERQMEELDDLESGTDIDIWDHKIAKEMRALIDIFAEVANENQIIAPMGRIYSDNGSLVKQFSDGLPACVSFFIKGRSDWFDLEVGDQRIRQPIIISSRP